MTFLEKIEPHLLSDDVLIQETVLHALHDFPNVPEEWTNELLKEAFRNKEKLSSILIYVENQTFNEEAVKILLENIPKMDKSKLHLALSLLDHIDAKMALKYRTQIEKYIRKDMWPLYELIVNGSKEEVYAEYGIISSALDQAESYQHNLYIKAKKLAQCIVQNGWISEDEIDMVMKDEIDQEWLSFEGIMSVYMIGLMKLEKYIPNLAGFLDRDDDLLLEEASSALIQFQSDEVVEAVEPYLKKSESIIFAASVVENIKSELAVKELREAYRVAEEIDDQDILIEALCHQLSKVALPEISSHMKNEYSSGLVDIEQVVYSYYSILGEHHPDLEWWRQVALERELGFRNERKQGNVKQIMPMRIETKVGRNDPCPCGSGKKYKKCCGK